MATASEISTPTRHQREHTARLTVFRILMALVALVHLVLFGAWRAVLAPWVTLPDGTDHGWERTPELHRLADGAAGILFVTIAVAAILLAIRPLRASGLAAWLTAAIAVTGAFSWVSALLQGHDDVLPMLVFSLVWLALVAAVFIWLHPEGRLILRGGAPDPNAGPGRRLRHALRVIAAAGLAVVAVAVVWRLGGGVFESPREDDVFSLVYLGTLLALGSVLAAQGRAGYRSLAAIVITGSAYAIAGGFAVALS